MSDGDILARRITELVEEVASITERLVALEQMLVALEQMFALHITRPAQKDPAPPNAPQPEDPREDEEKHDIDYYTRHPRMEPAPPASTCSSCHGHRVFEMEPGEFFCVDCAWKAQGATVERLERELAEARENLKQRELYWMKRGEEGERR